MQGVGLRKQALMGLVLIWSVVVLCSSVSLAKGGDERDQIILLNDSAAALEESNPRLAKDLTQFADEKEKALEVKAEVIKKQQTDRIKLLKDSAAILQQTYPVIAKSLIKMANAMEKL